MVDFTGQILAQGQHDGLMATCPKYKEMVEATEKKKKPEPEPEKIPDEEIPPDVLLTLQKVYAKLGQEEALHKFQTKLASLAPEIASPPATDSLTAEEFPIVSSTPKPATNVPPSDSEDDFHGGGTDNDSMNLGTVELHTLPSDSGAGVLLDDDDD